MQKNIHTVPLPQVALNFTPLPTAFKDSEMFFTQCFQKSKVTPWHPLHNSTLLPTPLGIFQSGDQAKCGEHCVTHWLRNIF